MRDSEPACQTQDELEGFCHVIILIGLIQQKKTRLKAWEQLCQCIGSVLD